MRTLWHGRNKGELRNDELDGKIGVDWIAAEE